MTRKRGRNNAVQRTSRTLRDTGDRAAASTVAVVVGVLDTAIAVREWIGEARAWVWVWVWAVMETETEEEAGGDGNALGLMDSEGEGAGAE
jgi:hypothetical protein